MLLQVSVFDLGRGAFLFMIPVAQGPGVLVDMHFGTLPHGSAVASPKSPPPRVLSPGSAGALQDVVLYCLGEDFGVSVVDCATGRVIGHSGSGQRGLKVRDKVPFMARTSFSSFASSCPLRFICYTSCIIIDDIYIEYMCI